MSLGAVNWALYGVPDVEPVERCVLLILADHADPVGGDACPIQSRVADVLGIADSAVGSALESLQRKGLIRCVDPGSEVNSVWTLAIPRSNFFASLGTAQRTIGGDKVSDQVLDLSFAATNVGEHAGRNVYPARSDDGGPLGPRLEAVPPQA